MKITLISLNYAPEITGTGLYSGELAEQLVRHGNSVEVICSYPFYPNWKRDDRVTGGWWRSQLEGGVKVHRCPCYIPARVTGLKRILHYLSFAISSLVPAISRTLRAKPELIVVVAPTLLSGFAGMLCAKLLGARSWIHVQDFEVEAGFATGQMKKDNTAGKIALKLERLILRSFDVASSISPEMCDKLVEKGVSSQKVTQLRNWANVEDIKPQSHSHYRERWDIKTAYVALYSGSIAKKQGIETIIQAARELKHRKDLTFIICGNGPTRDSLEHEAQDLENLQFRDLQPMDQLSHLLNLATVHLLPQKRDAADLVLPSKLANMLASGRPVVAGVYPDRGLAREVAGVGRIFTPENGQSLAKEIEYLLENEEEYSALSKAARLRAQQRWSKDGIIARAHAQMQALIAANDLPVEGIGHGGND